MVLLHGLACGRRMWFHQIRTLQRRFRVITYDQRGHCGTDAPSLATDYSAALLGSDLVGVLDALKIERAAIVGFSLGGGPALALAAETARISSKSRCWISRVEVRLNGMLKIR